MERNDRGYILVTALLLLSVLSVAGAIGAYKAILGSRISKVSGDYAKARQVAEAGLSQLFWWWVHSQDNTPNCSMFTPPDPGCVERRAVVQSVLRGTPAPAGVPFVSDLYGESIAELERRTGGLDAYVRASRRVRVYQFLRDSYGNPLGMQQVSNARWGKGSAPQVAVWATSYQSPRNAGDYPYGDANAGCIGPACTIVVYALGRDGNTRALVRESQGYFTQRLRGVTAITNAPPYSTWMDLCNLTNPAAVGASLSWASTRNGDVLVEATQAPYALGNIPSGTALSSNTNMGLGGKKFRKGTNSTAELTMDSTPLLAYSTHNSVNAVRAQWADTAMDTAGVDDPWPTLPKDMLRPGLAATPDKLRYFDVAGDGQLFALSAYRWGAEQFTCQRWYPDPSNPNRPNPSLGTTADPYANGAYCARAARLQALLMKLYPLDPSDAYYALANSPSVSLADKINKYWPRVTGRITAEDFWRNIRDGRPMFGIVRIMYPTKPKIPTGQVCASAGGATSPANPVVLYDVARGLNTITSGTSVNFTSPLTGSTNTVTIRPNSRLVVYGMLLLDYFYDRNGNYYFDPASGERSILAIESTDAYLKLEVPMMVNPALPRGTAGADLQPFPTVASTTSRLVGGVPRVENACISPPCRNLAGLAAPTGGWFPDSEGLIVQGAPAGQGSETGMMALMDPSWGTGGLLGTVAAELLGGKTKIGAATTPGLANMFSTYHNRLEYYYELTYQTANRMNAQYWPISARFPATLDDPFCVGALDCAKGGSHDGDKLHLLFPSGYAHGWKVALAVLDMHAPEWNGLLAGVHYSPASCSWDAAAARFVCTAGNYRSIVDLARMHDPAAGGLSNPGGAHFYGSPMGAEIILEKNGSGAVQMVPFDIVRSAQIYLGTQSSYFRIRADGGSGYGVLDSSFRDLPALAYSGGLLDTHQSNNVSGIVYTPSALEWETANKGGIGYVTGAVITGLGMYNKAQGQARQIYVFDPQAVDNINTQNTATVMVRFRRQVLH